MRYLSAQTFADRLELSVRTVRRWIADDKVESVCFHGARRIPESEIERLASPHSKRKPQPESLRDRAEAYPPHIRDRMLELMP